MEKNEGGQLVRALGLKESISMTIGTVVGVGLFTCGSSQIGYVGSGIIVITFLSLLISIWPCLIYGEMSAALPCAGGTYNYAKRGLNRVWANLAGWHYIISVVGIGAGETLAFSNYFKILFGELGINIEGVDSRIIAIVLVLFFLILNFRGIEMSGKAQTGSGKAVSPPLPRRPRGIVAERKVTMGWEELRAMCLQCTMCPLCQTRHNVVFGVGPTDAEISSSEKARASRRI